MLRQHVGQHAVVLAVAAGADDHAGGEAERSCKVEKHLRRRVLRPVGAVGCVRISRHEQVNVGVAGVGRRDELRLADIGVGRGGELLHATVAFREADRDYSALMFAACTSSRHCTSSRAIIAPNSAGVGSGGKTLLRQHVVNSPASARPVRVPAMVSALAEPRQRRHKGRLARSHAARASTESVCIENVATLPRRFSTHSTRTLGRDREHTARRSTGSVMSE